jgi:WD40 repeat protein
VLAQVGRDDDGDGVARVETTYLQLVMRRLWEVEMGAGSRVLRLRALEELGGAQAIIGGHLDRAMDDSVDGAGGLTQQQRLLAASAFHFLVTSGGTKIALSAQDLADLTGIAKVELEPVLRHLSSPKLHILRPISPRGGSGEPLYEIFHDALARPIVEWRGRVEDAERDARLRREREKKEEAQREAQEAERRAASERRRKRIALVLLGVAVAALVLGAIAFGIEQQDSAEENRDEAQSVEVSQRLADLSTSPTFGSAAAALASLEAYRLSPTFQARIDTLSALQLNPALPTIAVGHTRTVFGVTYWPGSTNLASGSGDGTVRLWDSRGQEIGKPLVAFPSPVLGVAVSPTGGGVRTLAASNAGGAVRTWDLDSAGRVSAPALLPAKRSGDPVVALGFDPVAASVLAVGRESGRVELWRFSARRRPHRVGSREAPGPVTGLAFGGGDALAVSSLGGTRVWPLARGRFAPTAPKRVPGATRALSVAMTAGGRIAVGGEAEAAVFSADMRPLMRMPMTSPANAVGLAASGSVLVVGSADSTITTWEVDSGRPFGPPRVEGRSAVISLAVGPGGRSFASAGGDNLVKAWALYPRHALANTVGGLDPAEAGLELDPGVRAAAVGAGDLVAAATGEAGTSVWRLDPGRPSRSAPQPLFRIPGFSEAVAYRGSTLAVQQGRSFVLYDTGPTCATMPREPCRLGAPADPHSSGAVTALALARYDGKLVVVSSGFRQGTAVIDVWDASDVAATGEVSFLATRSTRTPGAEIHGLAVGPPSTPLLAAAASDGKVRVWELGDPSDPRGIGVKSAHGNENQAVDAVAFSPDGSLLASAGGDQQVVLWEVEASDGGYTVEPTPGTLYQSQSILSLAFSPDGETLAAGDGTGSICLYDVESRQVIGRRSCLPGHRLFSPHAGVWTLAFAHQQGGGRWLLSGGKGQQLLAWNSILWDLDDDQGTDRALQDDVCALAGRDLTRVEWTAAFSSAPRVGPWHRVCSE